MVCTFRADLVGDWIALTDDQTSSPTSVVVDGSTLMVRSDGGGVTEKFHCVTWTDERRRQAGEEMVVTEHFDGCRPRYTCVRYQRRAAALLQMKLSQSRMWPLVDAVDQPVDCRAFSYDDDDDDDDSSGRSLRGQRFRLLYSREPRPPTSCQLPLAPGDKSLRNYTLMYNNDTRCTGTSLTEALNGLGLLLSVGDCGPGMTPGTRTTLLHCVKSSRLSTGDGVAIVTRSVSTPSDVRCWFYSAASAQPEMYWLAASDCGAVVRRLHGSSTNRLRHIAVLLPASRADQFRHHVTSTWSPQRHLPAERRRNDDLALHTTNISDAPFTPDFAADDRSNSTPETEVATKEEPANVFVVFAAMVIFTLLHIPCNLCRVA